MEKEEIFGAIEAILFASGSPVEIERIVRALELDTATVTACIDELIKEYSLPTKGVRIIRLNKSVQMTTDKQYGNIVRKIMDMKKNTPLSQAAMEVLAVVAYNQPVTKAFVEQVRGVDCSGVTEHFLRCFSIENLEGLPKLPEKEEKEQEKQEDNTTDSEE